MKRLLFISLLFGIALNSFTQKVLTYGSKAVTYGGKVATYSAYCPEYQAVYDAYTTKPDETDAYRQNLLVERGLDHGWWAVLDYFGLKAIHTNANGEALLNWKNPTGIGGLAVNAPTHTASQGFLFNGTTQYVNSRFTPSANGVQYTQNSASQILYVRTNVSNSTAGHGTYGNTDTKNCLLIPKAATNIGAIVTNDATVVTGANTNGSGMYINTRTAAAINKLYRNKVAIINGTTASIGVPTKAFYVGCYNDDDVAAAFRADQVALDAYGGGMTQALVDYMTDDFEEYMDSYSTGVIAMIDLEHIMQLQYLAFQIRINEYEKALLNPIP